MFENFLRKTVMILHVTVENRNPKMLYSCFPNWFGPSLLRRLTTPSSITEGRISLAAALAQASSASSLEASVDCSGKAFKALHLNLSRNTMTCHLLVSA